MYYEAGVAERTRCTDLSVPAGHCCIYPYFREIYDTCVLVRTQTNILNLSFQSGDNTMYFRDICKHI
jgi:hypothetical protein